MLFEAEGWNSFYHQEGIKKRSHFALHNGSWTNVIFFKVLIITSKKKETLLCDIFCRFNSILHSNKRGGWKLHLPNEEKNVVFFSFIFIFMTLHHSLMWEMSVGVWWCSCRWDEIVLGWCSGWASDSPWPSAVFATLPHIDFPSTHWAAKLCRKLPPAHWTAAASKANSKGSDGGGLNAKGAVETDGGTGGTPGRRDVGTGGTPGCKRHKCAFNDYLNHR